VWKVDHEEFSKKKFSILIFGTGEGMQALPEKEREAHMQK
jgi:hypothetical protein